MFCRIIWFCLKVAKMTFLERVPGVFRFCNLEFRFFHQSSSLMHVADDLLNIFFLFSSENKIWHSNGDNLQGMSNSVF